MDRYIQQLIEDLEAAAKNPPNPPYLETPPGFEEEPAIVNLGLTPYQSIEVLTGIRQEVFPEFNSLHSRHWRAVLDAIFKVFDSLKIKLVDAPKGMPKEWLYEALTSNWDHQVQYLPEEGMDLELCTGDPETCPYGMFCSCGIVWPDNEEHFELKMEIPDQYAEILPKIAWVIDAGWVCLLFGDTLVLKTISQKEYYNPDDPDALLHILYPDDEGIFSQGEKFRIEPLLAFEMADMMEDFASRLRTEPLRSKLFDALVSENPVEKFNAIVSQSDEKGNWLTFKQNSIEDYVRAVIWQDLRVIDFFPEGSNGLFNDDGTRIDPETVPIPNLCITCKSFYTGDAEENILCILNRNDQRNDPDFKCGAFEEI